MNIEDYFSSDYVEARSRFLELAEANGFALTHYRNDNAQAPDGSDLFTDVATIGSPDAENLIVLTSGTHGVEGYCGSGVQAALMGEGVLSGHPKVRIALVHAVNPYGFAHNRRVTEDNIDLNRNFLDFGNEEARDNGYGELHPFLVPERWEGEHKQAANAAIGAWQEKHGAAALQQAASGGQYTHSDGIFFGGTEPGWSARTLLHIVAELARSAKRANFIDFHTGLGPYGYGEMIAAGYPPQVARSFEFYSDYEVTDPDAGTSTSAPIQGTIAHGVERLLTDVETVFVALEYGTVPMNRVMDAVRGDNWLYQRGDLDSPLGQEIKRRIRDAFYCDEPEWKRRVWERALDVTRTTLGNLSA